MIELFRQFERESGIDVYGLGKDRAKWESALEKFGEMIVKECIRTIIVRKNEAIDNQLNVDEAMSAALLDIKEYFRVEE